MNFDTAPHLEECESKEPSLRRMIFLYYKQYFSLDEAHEFTNRYIDAFRILERENSNN